MSDKMLCELLLGLWSSLQSLMQFYVSCLLVTPFPCSLVFQNKVQFILHSYVWHTGCISRKCKTDLALLNMEMYNNPIIFPILLTKDMS